MKHAVATLALAALSLFAAGAARAQITIEAEDMSRQGYALDGRFIKVANGQKSGTARQTFSGPGGAYKVEIHVMPESDGLPRIELYLGDSLVHAFSYPLGSNRRPVIFTVPSVKLSRGDVIRLVGYAHEGALARVDKIVLIPITTSAAVQSEPSASEGPSAAPQQPQYPKQGTTGGLPVIPGASGFGINTRAGRGGTVYRVNNLSERGAGSLRACVEASGPRVCVFEVSGTLILSENLAIRDPFITIAGQTAPSPGVTLRGAGLAIHANDVLVQHLRIRVGDGPGGPKPDNRDAVMIEAGARDVYNVVLDHVSAGWSTDELLSTYAMNGPVIRDITIRNSIFAEALNRSLHSKGAHSAGLMVGPGTSRVTLVNNVFAFNAWRNPLVRDDSTDVVVVNNLIYGTRSLRTDQIDFGSRGRQDVPMKASVVGNAFIASRPVNTLSLTVDAPSEFQLYLRDNVGPRASNDPWSQVSLGGKARESAEASKPPVWAEGLVPMEAKQVEGYVLKNAGARPADRDGVDRRIVASIRERTGTIIDSPRQVGGWPLLAENHRTLTLPDQPNEADGEGYTRLERWLHEAARRVESGDRPE